MLREACAGRKNSYSPYSHFAVGAALKTRDGKIFKGCNVENSMYGAAICAERSALLSAISNGYREFESILIIGNKDSEKGSTICPPCAFCRQTLSEFVDMDKFLVILPKTDNNNNLLDFKIYTMAELYPHSFNSSYL